MTIILTALRDFRFVRRDRHRHLRALRWPLLRLRLWCDARKIVVLPITLPILVVVIVLLALETTFGALARGAQRIGEVIALALSRVLGIERDEQWFRDLSARWPRGGRILTLKEEHRARRVLVYAFTCDGDYVLARSQCRVDVADLLTCTAEGENPARELRMLWRNYAMEHDANLDAEALRTKHRLHQLFYVSGKAQ